MMKSLTFMISWLFLFLATAGQDKFPDFSEQSRYEIGGIVLNLGEEDTDAGTYAKYLERLIKDLRAEFHNDRFPVVIVGSGRGAEGNGFAHDHRSSKESGHVTGVSGNCDLCRNTGFLPDDNARAASRHPSIKRWFDNAGSVYLRGQASGEAMLKLLK
ncbi:MAG: hypothetical protein QNK82_06935 [Akkermansiaceae bacterium]